MQNNVTNISSKFYRTTLSDDIFVRIILKLAIDTIIFVHHLNLARCRGQLAGWLNKIFFPFSQMRRRRSERG